MSEKPVRRRGAVSNALLAAALRAQSAGVVIAAYRRTGQLEIVFANDSFCAMTGHARADLLGRDYGMLHVEPAAIAQLRGWLPQAQPAGAVAGEGHLVRADSRTLPAAWSFDALCDARGRLTHVIATYRDQTEKRALQEALVHAQRLDAVGRVSGSVAHDFYNLISVINGYCEMLGGQLAAMPQAARQVGEIHAAGRKAAELTQQLLTFSRRQPLNARVIDLNALIRDNVEILQRLIGEAGRLEVELAVNLPNVRTDAAQFQQVLINLVINARDALRDHGRIVITTAAREITSSPQGAELPPGPYVALVVADNGTGMDAETMKRLFEPFFTTKPEGKGTGLGLALVYGVVQQSGGTITVTSELLVGSRFEILLPAVAAPAEERAPAVTSLPAARGSETVWLIEADEVLRKMVGGMLTIDGYRATAVGTPLEAPEDPALLRQVQLLIGNLNPKVEKLARRILAEQPDLRVLIVGNPGETAPVSWLAADRQARLEKPYALSELLRAARALLDAGGPSPSR